MDADDGDLACCLVTPGDVDCRFNERGCRGVIGAELDRLSAFLVAVLTKSPYPSCRREGVGDCGGLEAFPNDLSAQLITCVAKFAFSFAESSSVLPPVGLTLFGSAGTLLVALHLVDRAAFAGRDGPVEGPGDSSFLDSRRSLRRTAVAAEHVEMDETALVAASAWDCSEVME